MGWSEADIPDQSGQVIVITGANSGLGYESARALAARGAHVVMACRSPARGEQAAAQIRSLHPAAALELQALDLGSLASVRAFCDRLPHDRVDVLLNNAGIMAVPRGLTADGFEQQLGTNHLGHFALTGLLLERLQAAPGGRIVNVSSLVHRQGRLRLDDLHGERRYSPWGAYGQSKLANLLFTLALHRRLQATGGALATFAAHPGYSATNLQFVAPSQRGARLEGWVMGLGNRLLAQTAAQGALPQLYAATSPAVAAGDYYGPGGPLRLWGAPAREEPAPHARRVEDAEALWARSVQETGVDYAALDA